jgi:hypothetical protein
LDLAQLMPRVQEIGSKAERNALHDPTRRRRINFGDPDSYASLLQRAQEDDELWEAMIRHALNPTGRRREHYEREGMIGVALPPVQNARLSSQQGLFLFNAAEGLTFEASLER